ncbi:PspC domain-containing protein [Humibacter albus]|uniref:PspC domain-containing protein n=1 Tax=Humibacter albus TaxID=427754 RepID=UPI0003B3033D|nr:PspC domain-containing protein [Humibacter albus]
MPDHTTHSEQPADIGSAPTNGARFFGWLRGLGLIRQNGWIGGVCGGVAARLGIDPIIVRGIAVVIAVLGGPAFLLYAAAWLLLPDAHGDIHLERLLRGAFDPPIIAIIVIALFSFLPFAQGFWWAGAQFWDGLSWLSSFGRVLWSLLVVALIVAVIVWAARNGRITDESRRPSRPAPYYPSTSPTDAGGGAASSASASAAPASTPPADPGRATDATTASSAAADAFTAASTSTSPGAPTAGADDLAAWRAQQDAWKSDYAAWTAQQADARAIRQQRSADNKAQAQALAAEAQAARLRRKVANPRTSAAYVFIALGAALIASGIGAAIALSGPAADYTVAIALAVATGIIGLSIVTAGILRRRSGFLTFVSIVLVLCTACAAVPPRGHVLTIPAASYWNAQNVSIYQPIGGTELSYDTVGEHRADVVQGLGTVTVLLQSGVSARVEVTQRSHGGDIDAIRFDNDAHSHAVDAVRTTDDGAWVYRFGSGAPDVDVRIEQGIGNVTIEYFEPSA